MLNIANILSEKLNVGLASPKRTAFSRGAFQMIKKAQIRDLRCQNSRVTRNFSESESCMPYTLKNKIYKK